MENNKSLKEFLSVLTELNICNIEFLSGNIKQIKFQDLDKYGKEIKDVQDLINSFSWEKNNIRVIMGFDN